MELYLKRQFHNGSINTVAKVTDIGEIELGGGEILAKDINSPENKEYAVKHLKARGFIEATKEEYDQKAKMVVREINELI